ncbi:MAG TPA: DUF1800 domain-containing protein [Candidatus Dormibacteraeota bacterium]|nr:DUF1800 domain-containing protein [Candidatus Dormibacteraeota bacterium]
MAENTALTLPHARHLLRRTGFGATAAEAESLSASYATRGGAVDSLLDFKPSRFRPGGRYIEDVHNKWVKYMTKTRLQLQEKLVLFWHDHFAASYAKVEDIDLMRNQNRLFRLNCKGDFSVLVKAVNKDAAMMEFLDTVRNRRNEPNENYGRELQELFTLGVKDLLGNANYAQEDVFQIARAFTGWDYDAKGVAEFHDGRHDYQSDYPERGPKRIFKTTGGFGINGADYTTAGEGAPEIDTVIDVILQHRYGPSLRTTVADHIAYKLITYFAHPSPSLSFVSDVVDASGFASNWNIAGLLKQIFAHDDFYLSVGAPGAGTPKSVKWPVDYAISAVRLLHMKLKGRYQATQGGSYASIRDHLTNMGQVLFEPPSVFGWDWELSWMSSSTLLARYAFARDLIASRDGGSSSFTPEKVLDASVFDLTDAGQIVDAVADALGVDILDPSAERTALIDYLTDSSPATPVDLHDPDTVERKLHGLFGLLLQSPAFQLQ